MKIAGGLIVGDLIVAYALTFLNLSLVETLGDFILVEAAVLFILAGFIDFSSSIGGTQLRKAILGSSEEYSSSKHKEVEKKAAAFVICGLVLLMLLVIFAAYLGRS